MKRMAKISTARDEHGFVLVAALSALVVLSLIGIAAMNTSNLEKNIAHNINLAEKTFYRADGGVEVGIEMIEWNISCPLGFNNTGGVLDENNPDPQVLYNIGGVRVADPVLAYRDDWTQLPWNQDAAEGYPVPPNAPRAIALTDFPSDGARSIMVPETMWLPGDNAPHLNLAIWGETTFGEGTAVQMAAGYEGKGKGAAGGGGVINYEDISQMIGLSNSQETICLGWRHLIGMEDECRPY